MKEILLIIVTLISSSMFGFCNLPQNPDDYRQWEQESLDSIKAQERVPPNEAIPKLGRWIDKLSGGANVEIGTRPVFHAAQSALLAIPGHAKYYQDKIEQTRAFVKHYHALSKEEQRKIQEQSWEEERRRMSPENNLTDRLNYDNVRGDAFDILGLLPSPEAVAVLGHFLEDPEGRDGKDLLGNPIHTGSDALPPAPNCGKAYFALGRLGIEHPPIPPTASEDILLNQERVDAWKDWWNEVKTGKRTYRFAGSNIEYGPDGPATKEQQQKIERDRKREEERAAGHKKSSAAVSETPAEAANAAKPLSIVGILATCALVGAAVWHFVRSGKRRTS